MGESVPSPAATLAIKMSKKSSVGGDTLTGVVDRFLSCLCLNQQGLSTEAPKILTFVDNPCKIGYMEIDEKYLKSTMYRAKVPFWIDEYLKEVAKNRGVNLKDVISEVLCDWAYQDDQFLFKVADLPSNNLWLEWRKERGERRKQQEKAEQEQLAEALANRL